jgi:hypothetical protein
MQTDNSQFDDALGRVLKKNLSAHTEAVPEGFKNSVLARIELMEEQELLRKVAWQGRLALASCIGFGVLLLSLILIYPGLKDSVLTWPGRLGDIVVAAESAVKTYWQVLVASLIVAGMCAYNLVQVRLARG